MVSALRQRSPTHDYQEIGFAFEVDDFFFFSFSRHDDGWL